MDRTKKIALLRDICTGRKSIDHLNCPPLPLAGVDGEYDSVPGFFTTMKGEKIPLSTIERLKRENPGEIIACIF